VALNGQHGAGPQNGPVALGIPAVGAPERSFGMAYDAAPKPMKVVLNWGRRYSLWVFNFGLACCAIEFIAASMARHDFIRLGVIPFAPGPRQADLMVVSGTVTDKMAPAVKRLYEQMPEPKYVISFGACANCGGPYWDSYAVTKGIDQVIPVDVYVPGCPPRPEALLQGIIKLQEKIAAEGTGEADSNSVRRTGGGGRIPRTPKQRKPKLSAPPQTQPRPIAPEAPTVPIPASEPEPVQQTRAPAAPSANGPALSGPVSNGTAPAATAPLPDLPPTVELDTVRPPQIDPAARTTELPVVKVPRRRYFRELRRARDHGLSLFDKAAHDQEWEYDDDER
jgi:NADH-quinone oxidoreductase subunit B